MLLPACLIDDPLEIEQRAGPDADAELKEKRPELLRERRADHAGFHLGCWKRRDGGGDADPGKLVA